MPTSCEIRFDHPDKVFYAGQLLRGTVRLTLVKGQKIRNIFVRIFGKAYAHWQENYSIATSDDGRKIKTQEYTGKESYLDETMYLVGHKNAVDFRLEPGNHTYTFEFQLPLTLPTSMNHAFGYIMYGAQIILDIPFWANKVTTEHFTILKPISLDLDPFYRMPINCKTEKKFRCFGCFFCFKNGALTVSVYVPVRGYAPGQVINVKIDVVNDSSKNLSSMDVQLIKEMIFFATNFERPKRKTFERVIIEESTSGVEPGKTETIQVNLRVPSIPPTDFESSNVVHVKYGLRVIGNIKDDECFSPLDIPITIGTLPIRDDTNVSIVNSDSRSVISNQPTITQLNVERSISRSTESTQLSLSMSPLSSHSLTLLSPKTPGPASASSISTPITPFDIDNPPSFEETILSYDEKTNFIPKYPMFKRQTSYSVDTSNVVQCTQPLDV